MKIVESFCYVNLSPKSFFFCGHVARGFPIGTNNDNMKKNVKDR